MKLFNKKKIAHKLTRNSLNSKIYQYQYNNTQYINDFNKANKIMKELNKNTKPFNDNNFVWHNGYYGHRMIHNPMVYPKSIVKKYHLGKKDNNNKNDDDRNREKILLKKAKRNNHLWYGLM